MRYLLIIAFIFTGISLFSQNTDELTKGNISFVSSQNVYVQFVNTDGIHIGDTLFRMQNNILKPVLIINNLSSISCVCKQLGDNLLSKSEQIYARKKAVVQPIDVLVQKSKKSISVNDQAIETAKKENISTESTSHFDGRVSVSAYLNNTSDSTINKIFKYNVSLDFEHIANSKLSAECDISLTNKNIYSLTVVDTTNIRQNVLATTNELRIYNLALKYDFSKSASLTFGRKINPNLANIGAVDGLMYENTGKHFSYGVVAGSRPDIYTYSINPNLLQFGAYVGYRTKNSFTSLAAFNQMNNLKTDRRFLYIQHSNTLLKNLDLFCSFEVDLYGMNTRTDSILVKNSLGNDSVAAKNTISPANTLSMTSTYISLGYRPLRNLSFRLSYDARKNIYYYETYKNYVDSLFDKETRQGLRFQTNFRPFKYISLGGTAGYRFPTAKIKYSANGYGYITYSQLPFIGASLTVDASVLKSNYIDGIIYGAALSRDFFNGKFYTELSYRKVNYTFPTTSTLLQDIGDISFSWRIAKKLILSADFEGTKDAYSKLDGRLFINISQRF